MHLGVFLLATVASSGGGSALADGNTVTSSSIVSVPVLFWNCGLLTDGGFSLISDVVTPMQRVSWRRR